MEPNGVKKIRGGKKIKKELNASISKLHTIQVELMDIRSGFVRYHENYLEKAWLKAWDFIRGKKSCILHCLFFSFHPFFAQFLRSCSSINLILSVRRRRHSSVKKQMNEETVQVRIMKFCIWSEYALWLFSTFNNAAFFFISVL